MHVRKMTDSLEQNCHGTLVPRALRGWAPMPPTRGNQGSSSSPGARDPIGETGGAKAWPPWRRDLPPEAPRRPGRGWAALVASAARRPPPSRSHGSRGYPRGSRLPVASSAQARRERARGRQQQANVGRRQPKKDVALIIERPYQEAPVNSVRAAPCASIAWQPSMQSVVGARETRLRGEVGGSASHMATSTRQASHHAKQDCEHAGQTTP